jgi:diguanylate cyclase (GGDEF)-like protein
MLRSLPCKLGMSRAYTMVLALLALNVLLGALCVMVSRSQRYSRPLAFWGWGTLIYAVGLALTLMNFLPPVVAKVGGNALIAFAPLLMIDGVLNHTRYRMRWEWAWPGFIAVVILLGVNALTAHPLVLVNFVAPSVTANVVFLIAGFGLLMDPPRDAKTAARFLAAACLTSVVLWSARIAMLLFEVGGTNDRERADLVISLFAIGQMIIGVGSTLALLWIEVRQMEAELERIAYSDALTGLPNRRATLARFHEELTRADRRNEKFALMVLDIDRFKDINDTFGHQWGDTVLKHVARTLAAAKRNEDVMGRIGGEEFLILLTGPADSMDEHVAEDAANRLREKLAALPIVAAGTGVTVTISAGLAVFPIDGRDWESLFSVADARLYAAKREGRNRVVGPARLLSTL